MITKRHFTLPVLLSIIFINLILNQQILQAQQPGQVIYFNSFESPNDTVGWQGYGSRKFYSDAPPDGGKQSLYVSGACIVPHAWITLGPFDKDEYFILSCYGKNLQIGGGASIQIEGNYSKGAYVYIDKKEWTFYQSADTLFCPAGKKIMLSMGAGGIVASAILVDKLEVIKLDNLNSVLGQNKKIIPFNLSQNYPNPFNPGTIIQYKLNSSQFVNLKVYDILGREITTLVNEEKPAGIYAVNFDGSKLPGGIYFYTMQAGNLTATKKFILLK